MNGTVPAQAADMAHQAVNLPEQAVSLPEQTARLAEQAGALGQTLSSGNGTAVMSVNATQAASTTPAASTASATDVLGTMNATHAASAGNATQVVSATGDVSPVTALPPVEFSWGGYFEAIGVMLILLAGLWLVLWLVRRYGKFRFMPVPGAFPRNGLHMETQLPLGPRKGLYVVRYLDHRLLLGVTEHQITLLQKTPLCEQGEQDAAMDEQTPAPAVDQRDADLFARMLAEEGGPEHVPAARK